MSPVVFMQGNEAVVEGALAAGARFYAGYPITPSSEIAELASRRLPAVGGVYLQMEDEIASIGAVIGASLAGAKAFTATSGPGFSLMQENIGLAVMLEVPCVVVNVMRSGPSTGLATKPAQADVMQARWGTHGDHPAVALAPWSVQECFSLTVAAFNAAERLRTPVFLLSDEIIGRMREGVTLPEPGSLELVERPAPTGPAAEYRPYRPGPDGVPPLAAFGGPYVFHATSSMHDEMGVSANDAATAASVISRLVAKSRFALDFLPGPEVVRSAETGRGCRPGEPVLLVAFGSSARSARQVMLDHPDHPMTLFRPRCLWPFPEKELSALLADHGAVVVAEMNTGQLLLEVERVAAGRVPVAAALRSDGEIITPEQIWETVREVARRPRPAAQALGWKEGGR
ncbi:MAG TPA: 2-oxoacid:acceptor oxidoreductase subunit alpha [Clostridiales bacterium]|nr:2-oxoacid:acceptor oxidoreductase subunit alpha [Clostridiales bacterium]HCW52044.1 2-oxoacid:acceptor oxidoreductase subunit alpha [Clostridiales bacterium]